VVTIGIFDGVHRGHVEILHRIRALAKQYNGESVVITLWPHPRFVLQPDNKDLKLLTTLDEKIGLIENHKIDNLIILPFDKDLANITYDRFVKEYIAGIIRAKHIVVGFNHHFGKDRKGTFENLLRSAGEFGIRAERLNQVIINNYHISSSAIRHMIEEGRINAANEALGYPYFMHGTVVKGNQIGTGLGYPTANIQPVEPSKLVPRNGVYAILVKVRGRIYKGMLGIGLRPTLNMPRHERTIEAHLFGFHEDIYDEPVKIAFIDWLRCEKKFDSLQELKEQLDIDKAEVLKLFETIFNLNKLI
jgi:riboflavin kinase/FMN adenylyltransferase